MPATQRIFIKNPLCIFTPDTAQAPTGLVIANGIIESLLFNNDTPNTACDQVFDATGLVILPGLINTHHHFYQTLTRA